MGPPEPGTENQSTSIKDEDVTVINAAYYHSLCTSTNCLLKIISSCFVQGACEGLQKGSWPDNNPLGFHVEAADGSVAICIHAVGRQCLGEGIVLTEPGYWSYFVKSV